MSRKPRSKRGRSGRGTVQKASGVLHPRVEKVGTERFRIVCVDVGKAKSKWMLCDFYGKVLIEPTEVLHTRCGFDFAIRQLREVLGKYRIRDQVVAVERTGNYHLPVKTAFAAAGFDTRIVHPFATNQFRQPADPGDKTDPNDLDAMFRATVTGFGLVEHELDDVSQRLRLLTRHRRDLVEKRASLCCQIREHLDALLPGYAAIFTGVWKSGIALHVARHFPTPELIRRAGVEGLKRSLRDAQIRGHEGVLQRIVTWASNAALPAFPSRYQSVDVDLPDGRIAANLVKCNHHFRGLNAICKTQGKDPRWSRIKVACRFTRILYQIVAGRQVFRHPRQSGRDYILDKLLAFHRHHATPPEKALTDLMAATQHIPEAEYHNEAAPLQAYFKQTQNRRRRNPQPIGEIISMVLAKLGVGTVQSTSEDRDPS